MVAQNSSLSRLRRSLVMTATNSTIITDHRTAIAEG
jgi:hypothetical protein